MLTITTRQAESGEPEDHLVLAFEHRQRSRLRGRLASGQEVILMLERGGILRGGDRLRATDGRIVQIVAAEEPVSRVVSADPALLIRAAYHLGNRHVPLEIGSGWLQFERDHVLEQMVLGLGLQVHAAMAPFEPEGGAYTHAPAGHTHHDHDHEGHDRGEPPHRHD